MHSDLSVEEQHSGAGDLPEEPDAFVYFVDPDELALLSPGWPEEMRLLVCMDAMGLCEFVVFHDEEEAAVFDRVSDMLDRPVGAFAVSPQVEGLPTRRLLFSEENALLKSIQDSDTLQEHATDYLINYNFAREEGLDLDKFMRARRDQIDDLAARVRTDKIFAFGTKTAPKKRAPLAGPPEGYAPSDAAVTEDCCYIAMEMWLAGGRIRIAARSDVPLPMVPTLAREIALRDDFTSIYLPRDILPARWRPQDQVVIDIPIELFPAGFPEHCGCRKVQVAIMPRGIFVEFGALIPTPEPDMAPAPGAIALPEPRASLRRQLLKSFHIPLIAVAGLGITGFFTAFFTQAEASNTAAQTAPTASLQGLALQGQP